MYTNGRLIEDARKIAENASSDQFLDIALQSAEETLAEFYSEEWPFAAGEGSAVTVAPYSTGTITLSNNSAAVTGSGTVWLTSWPTPAILRPTDGVGEPLVVTSFNSGTSLTLDRAYPHTGDSGLTYTLEFPCYDVSNYIAISGVMIGMSGWKGLLHLTSLQEILYDRMQWTPGGYPCEFFLIPGDGTTSAKLVLNPAPKQIQTIRFRYTRAVPEFRCLIGGTEVGGTASIVNTGVTVTGVGTDFLKLGYTLVGHYFEVPDQDGVQSLVSAVASDTSMTVAAWGGTDVSGGPFYVSPKILMPDDMRPMLRDLMRWKTFQNTGEIERANAAEIRYRRNRQIAWRRVNRMRMDRDVRPVDVGSYGHGVDPPAMPWQLVMEYAP